MQVHAICELSIQCTHRELFGAVGINNEQTEPFPRGTHMLKVYRPCLQPVNCILSPSWEPLCNPGPMSGQNRGHFPNAGGHVGTRSATPAKGPRVDLNRQLLVRLPDLWGQWAWEPCPRGASCAALWLAKLLGVFLGTQTITKPTNYSGPSEAMEVDII